MKSLSEMTEPELQGYFAYLARLIESVLPPGPSKRGKALFMLLVFDDPGMAQYVSNCDRATRVKALREAADRLEAREDIPR
jgi:hypothetical protein